MTPAQMRPAKPDAEKKTPATRKTILWNRTTQDVVTSSGKALVFATEADADVWLDRAITDTVYDKVAVR